MFVVVVASVWTFAGSVQTRSSRDVPRVVHDEGEVGTEHGVVVEPSLIAGWHGPCHLALRISARQGAFGLFVSPDLVAQPFSEEVVLVDFQSQVVAAGSGSIAAHIALQVPGAVVVGSRGGLVGHERRGLLRHDNHGGQPQACCHQQQAFRYMILALHNSFPFPGEAAFRCGSSFTREKFVIYS